MVQKISSNTRLSDLDTGNIYCLDVSAEFFSDYMAVALWHGHLLIADAWDDGGAALRFTEVAGDVNHYMVISSPDLSKTAAEIYDYTMSVFDQYSDDLTVPSMDELYAFLTVDSMGTVMKNIPGAYQRSPYPGGE